jgi:uncharacterized membrane protein
MNQTIPPIEDTELLGRSSRRIIKSLKAKADAKRTVPEVIADWATAKLGSIHFLVANVIWFIVWLSINTGLVAGIEPFDPFPFGLLTTIVSLEAIILAIFVLISQNRASQIDDLREEIDLQVDIITEQELTKLMKMTNMLMKKNGIDLSADKELEAMLKPANINKIEKILEKQVLENHKVRF